MKKLLSILLLTVGFSAHAVDFQINSTVTITNAPTTNGVEFVWNADTRLGTNAMSSTTFATNTSIGGITTNLYRQIIRYPFAGVDYVEWIETNQFVIHAIMNVTVANEIEGDWASIVLTTNAVGEETTVISVPAANWNSQADATNAFTQLVDDINSHSTSYINKTTNGVNYGTAFRSPGSGDLSEQFGSSADASGQLSWAGGANSIASGINATATGQGANALDDGSSAYGNGATVAFGAPDGLAVGASATVSSNHTGSAAIGAAAATTRSYQVVLGEYLVTDTTVQKRLEVLGYWMNPSAPFTNNTSQAAGDNSGVVIGEHENVLLSGMGASAFSTAGIVSGRDGRTVTLWNTNGASWTIPNNSGLDATPANRIITGTAGTLTITNNPGSATFIYNTNVSRWWVKSHSN